MFKNLDILVLGATGFTGRLVTRYLFAHPQFRSHFSFAIAGRSRSKLDQLAQEFSLDSSIKSIVVDLSDFDSVQAAVQQAKIVINAVGPYWKWGTPIVKACVRHGVHYVDLSGETHWIKEIAHDFDYGATKTGSIVVPACGFDSVPSDISAFLSFKALKRIAPEAELGDSTTAFDISGGFSGGTINTAITSIDGAPAHRLRAAQRDYCLSPVEGVPSPGWKLLYSLPLLKPTIYGFPWFMRPVNRSIVQRTWGLHQLHGRTSESIRKSAYGPHFNYDEFWKGSGFLSSLISGVALVFGLACFAAIKPLRWLLGKYLPPGFGPSEEKLQKGYMVLTNVSTSSNLTPPLSVKTVIRGRGDPGYLLASIMLSEAALAIVLSYNSLPELAKRGGVLTPMSACGDVLISRLEQSGRFEFESGRLSATGDTKKTR